MCSTCTARCCAVALISLRQSHLLEYHTRTSGAFVPKVNSGPKGNGRNLHVVKPQSVAMQEIRFRAYELYERRGRGDGHALDDWLQAETELLSLAQPSLKRKTRK